MTTLEELSDAIATIEAWREEQSDVKTVVCGPDNYDVVAAEVERANVERRVLGFPDFIAVKSRHLPPDTVFIFTVPDPTMLNWSPDQHLIVDQSWPKRRNPHPP